jgi:hypothetical protein
VLIAVERLLLKLRQPRSRAVELIELRRRLRAERAADVEPEERALAAAILAQKQRVSAGLHAVTSCGSCAKGQPFPTGHHAGGACCSGTTAVLFDDHELAALVHAGTRLADLTPPREEQAGCAFRGSHGCTLDTAHRPARCVHYICDVLRRELHDRGQLSEIEADLAELDRLMQQFTALHQARLDRETVAPLIDALVASRK